MFFKISSSLLSSLSTSDSVCVFLPEQSRAMSSCQVSSGVTYAYPTEIFPLGTHTKSFTATLYLILQRGVGEDRIRF